MRSCLVTLALVLVLGCASNRNSTPDPSAASPSPTFRAARIENDFILDGDVSKHIWRKAQPVRLERESRTGAVRPELSTTVRALWSDKFLYLAYDVPFTKLTTFEPVQSRERMGLWERDVVEAFIGCDMNAITRYTEYEVSPTNERLDVRIALPKYDFEWSSDFESATQVDEKRKRWTTEMRIPLSALCENKPHRGDLWRINLYRCDYANKAFLTWNPTMQGSFHVPDRFGTLVFE